MSPDNILSKVHKLLRLSQSSNPHEAALAAAKAQQLIDEHNLSSMLLSLDANAPTPEPEEEIRDFGKMGAPLDEGKQNDRWRWSLAYVVMKANGCRGYMSSGSVHIIGRPSDAETVRYLYAYLKREVERLADASGKGAGKTWRNNFRLGVIDTISRKLKEQQDAFKREAQAAADTSMALVRVNTALAKIEAKGSSVEAWTKKNLKLKTGTGSASRSDYSARAAGRQAGEHISIGNAKGGLTSGTKALKGGF